MYDLISYDLSTKKTSLVQTIGNYSDSIMQYGSKLYFSDSLTRFTRPLKVYDLKTKKINVIEPYTNRIWQIGKNLYYQPFPYTKENTMTEASGIKNKLIRYNLGTGKKTTLCTLPETISGIMKISTKACLFTSTADGNGSGIYYKMTYSNKKIEKKRYNAFKKFKNQALRL